jgi:SynChlorMet cassette protein ScmC
MREMKPELEKNSHRYSLELADGKVWELAGGTGKSTCHAHLPDYWEKLCDDQTLILGVGDGNFRVHPFPTWSVHLWRESKKQWYVERSVPLKAVFFLEQAQKDEAIAFNNSSDAILKYLEAAKQVWQPVWSKVERKEKNLQSALLFDNIIRMVRAVPAYRLCATLDGEFWKEMERVCI